MKKMIRKKLALMLANLKKKRPFYTEIEYLENTSGNYAESGTGASENVGSYINTGIHPKPNGIVKIGLSLNDGGTNPYQCLFGGYDNNTRNFGVVIQNDKTYFLNGNQANISDIWTRNLYYEIEFNASQKKLIKNGVSTTYSVGGLSADSNLSIYLFTNNAVGGSMSQYNTTYTLKGKIYYFRYYEGDTLVCDMIPVLDWDMTPCMYDKVSGQLFYNQGTGDFSYGREIHYVEYLESTGTQYINTGISTWDNTLEYEISLGIRQQSGTRTYFGCYDAWGGGKIVPAVNTFVTNYRMQSNFNTGFSASSGTIIGIQNGQNGVLSLKGDTLSWSEGSSLEFDRGTSFTKTNLPILLFGTWYSGGPKELSSFPINYAKIWLSNTLVRDFAAAIDENGVGFMFDRVTHSCFLNAGTGAFKYPATELEYIRTTGSQYVDTGYMPNQDTKIELVGKFNDIYPSSLWATRWSQSPTYDTYGAYAENNSLGMIYIYYGRYSDGYFSSVSNATFPHRDGNFIKFIQDKNKLDFTNLGNSANWTYTFNEATFQSTRSLTLFYFSSSSAFATKGGYIKSCKIWDNGTLVRDFIPCYKDGVLGLFDKENDVFYDNDGTGTFTGGKIVEPEYE